jgi:hypothetical protein
VIKISKRPASFESASDRIKPKKFKTSYHCYAGEYIKNAAVENKEGKEAKKFSVTD